MSNPRWLSARNNAGCTPLQLLCKYGTLDEAKINVFAPIGGPNVFAIVDKMGNTPLHTVMRDDVDVRTLDALIRVYPEALHVKNMYDDTPLHLACLRGVQHEAVRMVTIASGIGLEATLKRGNSGRLSPLLMENTAGQTPIGIAMEAYQGICLSAKYACHVRSPFDLVMSRCFEVLATLVKILHYGSVEYDTLGQPSSLLVACLSLHRKDVRLDPAFIRRALVLHPEEALCTDEDGNYPLHIEASIPIEKMLLLRPDREGCCRKVCQERKGLLRTLFEVYPEAACQLNGFGEFPLNLMAQSGRPWDATFLLIIQKCPGALYFVDGLDERLMPRLLEKLTTQCGKDTVYSFLRNMPGR
jgi:hypothetical protein